MQDNEGEAEEELSKLRKQVSLWRDLFAWFVHDLFLPVDTLNVLVKLSMYRNSRTIERRRHHMQEMQDATDRVYCFLRAATILAYSRERFHRDITNCSIASILQRLGKATSYSWLKEDSVITIDKNLLTVPPIRMPTDIVSTIFSNLLLFIAAISKRDKPALVSSGFQPNEVVFHISVRAPGLTEEDISRIWIAPDLLFQGQLPNRIFSKQKFEYFDFSIQLAIPTALILADCVPCEICPTLESPFSLSIKVSFKEKLKESS